MASAFEQIFDDAVESAFGNRALFTLSRIQIAPRIVELVPRRVRDGQFLGGGDQEPNTGYSKTTLPAFFLGRLKKNSAGRWQIASDKLNKTVTPRQDELLWRKVAGEPMAFLVGGYAKFKQLSGRNPSMVNLTQTGRMLNSFDAVPTITTSGVEIEAGATGGEQQKAAFTDAMYEWLGLADSEVNQIENIIRDFVDDQFGQIPDARIEVS